MEALPLSSVGEAIGGTPAVFLRRLTEGLVGRVLVKLEARNPGGSVKDRVARWMLESAEREGRIVPGQSILVESTSGNTGIALAMLGASRGYRVILTMPEGLPAERLRLLRAYGAELVLTPSDQGMRGALDAAHRVVQVTPGAFSLNQFENPSNPWAHYATTGPEVEAALSAGDLELGAFVAGVGTGGTVSGVGRYLKERRPAARIVAVEPDESPIISQRLLGRPERPAPHLIHGIGADFVPDTLDLEVIDDVITVDSETSNGTARRLAAEEGLLCGISSGANVAVALRLAARPEMRGKVVVTIAPSSGERSLLGLWEGSC